MTWFRTFLSTIGRFAALILLATAPAAAQVIKPDEGGASCQLTPVCDKHEYVFVPYPGQFFLRWEARGDFKLLTSADQNPVVACSAGYGKGRLTAHYYTFLKEDRCREQCPDTIYHLLHYDVFKQFKAPDPITGPACVLPGQTVTYSVPPLLTDWPHRNAGIGTDAYFWSGFPTGSTLHFSGDSSAVTVTLPTALPGSFKITAQVGRCNASTPAQLGVNIDQSLATAVTMNCPTGGTGAPLSLTVATLPGIGYTVILPVGWTFANGSTGTLSGNGQPQNVYFALNGSVGNLLITSTGGCNGPQTTGLAFMLTP